MSRLSGAGISIDVPTGWDARIFRRPSRPGETTHAVLHAGNFSLPPDAADYGDGAVELMGPDHLLLSLVEFHPSSTDTALFAVRGLPLPLRTADASRTTLQRALGGQAGIQRFFTQSGRAWSLYVVLGSFDRRSALVSAANTVLSSLEISR